MELLFGRGKGLGSSGNFDWVGLRDANPLEQLAGNRVESVIEAANH
jgi:hypothetical protein